MGYDPKVSVITLTYNHEKFIGRCIESVLAQTYTNWEMIIIDDGSTDNTQIVVSKYKDPRIKYIRQEHKGIWKLGENYNKALKYAKGDLIAILEGDDFWPPYKLEKQINMFKNDSVVLSWGKAAVINEFGKIIGINPMDVSPYMNLSQEETIRKLLFKNFIPACTVMCRRDALLSIGGFKQPRYSPFVDVPTWLELSLYGKFQAVDDIMGFWRRHSSQITVSKSLQMAYATKYSIEFFNSLPYNIKKSLNVDMDMLVSHYKQKIARGFFYSGRKFLVAKNWSLAKRYFRYAYRIGDPYIKCGAIFGLIAEFFKMDIEYLMDIIKKVKRGVINK